MAPFFVRPLTTTLAVAVGAPFAVVLAESLAAGLPKILGVTLGMSLAVSLGASLGAQSPETRLDRPGADS